MCSAEEAKPHLLAELHLHVTMHEHLNSFRVHSHTRRVQCPRLQLPQFSGQEYHVLFADHSFVLPHTYAYDARHPQRRCVAAESAFLASCAKAQFDAACLHRVWRHPFCWIFGETHRSLSPPRRWAKPSTRLLLHRAFTQRHSLHVLEWTCQLERVDSSRVATVLQVETHDDALRRALIHASV